MILENRIGLYYFSIVTLSFSIIFQKCMWNLWTLVIPTIKRQTKQKPPLYLTNFDSPFLDTGFSRKVTLSTSQLFCVSIQSLLIRLFMTEFFRNFTRIWTACTLVTRAIKCQNRMKPYYHHQKPLTAQYWI